MQGVGKCCGEHLSLGQVIQPENTVCESGNGIDKRAESTGEVVSKTNPAGGRGFSPKIKRLKVSFIATPLALTPHGPL